MQRTIKGLDNFSLMRIGLRAQAGKVNKFTIVRFANKLDITPKELVRRVQAVARKHNRRGMVTAIARAAEIAHHPRNVGRPTSIVQRMGMLVRQAGSGTLTFEKVNALARATGRTPANVITEAESLARFRGKQAALRNIIELKRELAIPQRHSPAGTRQARLLVAP